MKIVVVTACYPLQSNAVVGGVEGVCYYLTQSLNRMVGMEVEVVLPNAQLSGVAHSSEMTVNGIKVRTLVAEGKQPKYFKLLVQTPRLLKRLLSSLDCDLIHFQGVAGWTRYTKRPSVVTVHGINERDTLFRGNPIVARLRSWGNAMTEGRARRRVQNVIAISPYVHPFLGCKGKQRVWDIPNPVADVFFDVQRNPQSGTVFSAATLMERKNQAGLIEAFSRMGEDCADAQLRLAGAGADGPYGQHCREVAQSLKVADRVHFLGALSIDQVLQELGRAHCLALTSHQETAPLSISEAMAAGVPVVASRRCGIPWMVEDGVTGRLVDPGNPDDIARSLRRILIEDDAAAMGRAAKRIAETEYRASEVARRTAAVYREILDAV